MEEQMLTYPYYEALHPAGRSRLDAARLALDFVERRAYKVHNAVFPLEKVKLKALESAITKIKYIDQLTS